MFNTPQFHLASAMYFHFQDTTEFEPFYVFSDKATYLGWVAIWKSEYRALTQEIRACKAEGNRSWRETLRRHAHAMMLVRMEGKRRSWEMKQQNKAVQA